MRDPADGRIVTRREGPVLLIGIDRVAKRNGFSPVMLDELTHAYAALERGADIRCGLLYAEGPHFTAGLELDKVAPRLAAGRPVFGDGMLDPFNLHGPRRTKPLVVAVQGICFTLGIELMLAADVVVAAADCRFSQLEVKRGIMASGGATIRMAERAGSGNALRYLLTGDEFDAVTALRLGFVQEVVPAGEQFSRAFALAQTIAAQAPLAVAATLASVDQALTEGPRAAAAALQPVQRRLLQTADAAEGIASFRERRTARFTGR